MTESCRVLQFPVHPPESEFRRSPFEAEETAPSGQTIYVVEDVTTVDTLITVPTLSADQPERPSYHPSVITRYA